MSVRSPGFTATVCAVLGAGGVALAVGVNGVASSLAAAALTLASGALGSYALHARRQERQTEERAKLAAELERRERARRESEQVLRFVVDEAPTAMVFLASSGRVLLANALAREVFFEGQDLVGRDFLGLLTRAPEVLRRAMAAESDEIVSVEDAEGETKTFFLGKRQLTLDGQPVVLLTVHDLTRGIGRREVDVWKQVIRVIAHEANNSLAPISTLATTGRVVARGGPSEETLARVFETISERATHLSTFLEGYARFARLPPPVRRAVVVRDLAERMRSLHPGIAIEGEVDVRDAWLDVEQIEQLLLNLIKNAREAGSAHEDIALSFVDSTDGRALRIAVSDRGRGMSADVMKRAVLPLFSTKAGGRGIGLALCREIAEAHGGSLRLAARDGGGVEVTVRIPRHRLDERDGLRSVLSLSGTS